jgi:hypothetical protein
MKVKLQSDFRDFYDHVFCGSWEQPNVIFSRMMTNGPARHQMFIELQKAGLTVPRHGTVHEMIEQYMTEWKRAGTESYAKIQSIVIYDDPHAHAGDGKRMITVEQAESIPDTHHLFASEYIPAQPNGYGLSLRYLRIGRRQFWLRYISKSDWRSNCGDVTIDVLSEEKPKENIPTDRGLCWEAPMMAVDFVGADKLYAIDLNVSPGLAGTGIEERVRPMDILAELEWWYAKQLHPRCTVL